LATLVAPKPGKVSFLHPLLTAAATRGVPFAGVTECYVATSPILIRGSVVRVPSDQLFWQFGRCLLLLKPLKSLNKEIVVGCYKVKMIS